MNDQQDAGLLLLALTIAIVIASPNLSLQRWQDGIKDYYRKPGTPSSMGDGIAEI